MLEGITVEIFWRILRVVLEEFQHLKKYWKIRRKNFPKGIPEKNLKEYLEESQGMAHRDRSSGRYRAPDMAANGTVICVIIAFNKNLQIFLFQFLLIPRRIPESQDCDNNHS